MGVYGVMGPMNVMNFHRTKPYLIPDVVRGRYCTIRYSLNIIPVWNYFSILADLPCTDLFSIVSMLLCSCYVRGHC